MADAWQKGWRVNMHLVESLRRISKQREILRSLVVKNLKDKYIGSVLGITWSVINPLLITLAVTFIFTKVMRSDVRNFPLLVLSGLLPWLFFVNSICESANSLRQNLDILNRFVITKEIIPLSVVLSNFLSFLPGLLIMLPIFIFFNHAAVHCLWLLPCLLLLHICFTLGVSLLLSIGTIYYKDLTQLLNVAMMFWFWITPAFYTLESVPAQYRWIVLCNPATAHVLLYQKLLYHGVPGEFSLWLLGSGIAAASLFLGYGVFLRHEARILKYM